ncbi:TetR/AcrR family transcriptional regulator [Ideonella sp.]|uniref:TetR/AcrR family transcriptional regulator n=1 Tax=Ideonella sp. TaxID=1929293 RepID=UPI0035B49D90
MSRPKTYEDEALLRAAMQAFRERGYAGTSIKDLEQATGLRSGSLYHGYRDKQGLFNAALAHYNDTVVGGRIAQYLAPGAGLAGLHGLFRSLLHEPAGARHGCLLTNSAIEFGPAGGEALTGVHEGLDLLRQAFENSLQEAIDAGHLPRAASPAGLALRLLALYQGVLVLVRGGRPDSELAPLIDTEFAALAATPAPATRRKRRSA